MEDYYICEIEGCDEQIRKGTLCHYHNSLTNRPCAWYYHKDLGAASVEWCGKKDFRFTIIDCRDCKSHIDPKDGIEIIEKLTGLNQG